jgi:glycosyltransferase involved in cell wall biosynthesis
MCVALHGTLRVLYHHRIASKDGQYVHVSEIVKSLTKLGVELRVVSPALADTQQFGGELGLIAALKRRLPKALYEAMELAYSVVDFFAMAAAIVLFRPAIVYERYNLFLPSGVLAAKLLRVPLILEVNAPLYDERRRYGGIALERLARWAERFVWRNADAVLPVTHVLAERIRSEGVDSGKIEVIPNGVDPASFATDVAPTTVPAFRPGSVVVGFVGFCREWHRLDRVIALVAEDASKSLSLVIVGDGPVIRELKAQVAELGCADRVHFAGLVGRDEMPSWLAAIDIAIQPAVVPYASPLKLIEYMASGKAIVAPAQDNIRELLRHEQNALLVAEDDTTELLAALRRLAGDGELRARLGAGARATVREMALYWDENARRIMAIARKLRPAESVRVE